MQDRSENLSQSTGLSRRWRRRDLIKTFGGSAVVMLAAACSQAPAPAAKPAETKPAAPAATTAPAAKPAATTAPAAAAKPAEAAKPGEAPKPAQAAPASASATKDTWKIGFVEEAESLDPGSSVANGSSMLQSQVLEPLVDLEGPDLKPTGIVAEKWENPNPLTWRFTLRQGLKFNDGTPVTAEDVKYSIAIHQDPKARRYSFTKDFTSVEVKDAKTVDITTAEPSAAMLVNLTRLYVVSQAAREKMGAEKYGQAPVGTGALRVVSWTRDQEMQLEANPYSAKGKITPAKVIVRPIPNASTRTAELLSGGVDIIAAPSLAQVPEIEAKQGQITPIKGARILIFQFNVSKKPFDDVRVRQAINYAVDREAIVKQVLGNNGLVMAGPFVPGWLGYTPSVTPYPYDPAKAKALLAEAGLGSGLEMTWATTSGVFLRDQEIAEAVVGQLGEVGVKVKITPTERAKIQADAMAGAFDGMTSLAWGTQWDPDSMIAAPHTKASLTDPQIQDLISKGRTEVDLPKRTAVYEQIHKLVHDQACWLFVHAQDELWAKRSDVPWTPYNTGGSRVYVRMYQVGA